MRAVLLATRPYIALALLVCVGIFAFFPPLFLGQAFYGEEQSGFYYLISYYVKESTMAGTPMTWIAHYYGGVPASLQQFVGAWYPLNRLLFVLFDFFTAHHLSMTIATIAGLLFSYWFGRPNGWTRPVSAILALLYLSATSYGWILIGTTAAHSFAILPGLLAFQLWGAQTRRYYLATIAGGITLGIGFLAGFMQIVFYDYIVAGLYALFLDYSAYTRNLSIWRNIRSSFVYAGMTVTGLAVGFLQFYPSASLIELTIRTNTYAIQNAFSPNVTELLAYFLPPYFSVPFFGGGGAHGFYITAIGIVSLILALRYFRSPSLVFFSGVYVFILGFAFHLPVFSWLNEHLPPFSRMGGNFRWMVGAAFPLAFAGSYAIGALLDNPDRISLRVRTFTIGVMSGISLLLIFGSLLLSSAVSFVSNSPETLSSLIAWYTQGKTLTFPAQHYVDVLTHALRDVEHMFSLLNPRFAFGVALWPIATYIMYLLFFRPRVRAFMPSVVTAYVAVTVMGTIALHWNELVPQSLYAETPEIVRTLHERERSEAPYRIFGYILGDGSFLQMQHQSKPNPEELTSIQFQSLFNNINLYFDIERMDGMEPYRTLRHNRLLNTVIAHDWAGYVFDDSSPEITSSALDQLYNRNVQRKSTIEEKLADFPKRLPLLSMMNVKYVYSPFPLEGSGLVYVAAIPVTTGTTTRFTLHLYENTGVLPRLYASKEQVFASSERDAFVGVIKESDFSKRTWIECTSCATHTSSQGIIRTIEYNQGYAKASVSSDRGTWVVLSDSFFPGWHAYIDGKEVELLPANYLFMTVYVPAGEHTVEFIYEDVALDLIS